MLRKTLLTLGASLALTATPLAAQEQAEEDAFAALAGMFEAEPLTAEQEERLPLAQEIVAKMIPEGAMQEMMSGMMDGMFGEMMKAGVEMDDSASFVAGQLGLDESDLNLTPDQITQIANMFDPARLERKEREAALVPEMVGEMMALMEPTMRRVMAELYAINFNQRELGEIDTFFSTETGASFARKSFTMSSDPRIVAASMESLPMMMGVFADMESRMAQATADLPAARSYGELTAAERAEISAATGYDEENLAEWSLGEAAFMVEEAAEDAVEAAESADSE